MQHVYTARDEMDAHFVKGLLEQAGIEAVVLGESLEAAFGTLPLGKQGLPGVWVREEDVERAMPIIEEYRRIDRTNADEPDDRPQAT
jgi:hypothetical protein